MIKRKFDSKRAYKLASRITVALSVLFGLFGLLQLRSVSSGEYSLDRIGQVCIGTHAEVMCQNYYTIHANYDYSKIDHLCSGEVAKVGCESYYILERGNLQNSGWKNLGIAVTLFIIFFGGTGLYRYLFPKIKDDDR